MTKLITETPEQPIPFLIDHLQSKQGNRGQLQRTLSGSAALWAESETSELKGTRRDFRNFDKPWQFNAKKPKKSKSDLAVCNISPPSPESRSLPRSVDHSKWIWRTKPESRDFDELNHILQESKKLGKALENLSRSIAISDELDKETVAFNSSLLRPRVIGEWIGREENDADPLAAEMLQPPIPRSKNEQWEGEERSPSPAGRLQGDNLAERTEETSQILHSPDELIPDSLDSLPGTEEALLEEGGERGKSPKVTGPGEAPSGGQSLKNYMEEDESLKQLQVVHQPWILPSDTESEGVEVDQEKRSAHLLLCVPCSSCPTLVYSGMFAQALNLCVR
uniref:Vestibule 1 n=1 Tax=Rousettus aegyptiacus TaxID=9407 RepID=A0A7J8C0Z8_ROUAE|nr:vestibule 1 [Rousettus aegyptiacus]